MFNFLCANISKTTFSAKKMGKKVLFLNKNRRIGAFLYLKARNIGSFFLYENVLLYN